jgi:purine nucleoside permease
VPSAWIPASTSAAPTGSSPASRGSIPTRRRSARPPWAEWVIDGSLLHEIDAREIPPDWPSGHVPLDHAKPYPQPVPEGDGVVYRLDPDLVDWAYELTRKVALDDTEALRAAREPYVHHPAARQALRVQGRQRRGHDPSGTGAW